MNQKNRRTLFITTMLCTALFTLTVVSKNLTSRAVDISVWLYGTAVLVNIILNIALSSKAVSENGAKELITLSRWIMPVTVSAFFIAQVYPAVFEGQRIMDTFVYVFLGILFMICGNYFPKNHRNPYVGLKFPWLLHDEESWHKTHRLGSYTWLLSGMLMIVHPLHHVSYITIPLVIALSGAVPLLYSLFLFYKNLKSRNAR